jgi:hypothetical protein
MKTRLRVLLVVLLVLVGVLVAQQATQTPALGFNKIVVGSTNWGALINANWTALDNYLSGVTPIPALTVSGTLTHNGASVFNGSSSITIAPTVPAASLTGWKWCLFSTSFCTGVAANTEAHLLAAGSWFSVFLTSPASNATSSVPDTNAKVSLGVDGSVRAVGLVSAGSYVTATNCSSTAAPAVCAAAPAGMVVIAAAGTTVTVNTTAVTANSEIFLQEDSSAGTRLGATCNTTLGRSYVPTARVAGTSFTITASAAPATNPACLSYRLLN